MQVEADDREIFRVLRMHRLVNERITHTLENAQRVVAECRQEILDLVSYIGEDARPEMQDLRIKLFGYTD